ncbi:SGNH/GDSL hydrolase family protein [Thermodesulfobacteriota bacterium]
MEKRLAHRGVEVINLGVGGYGTIQQYLYLKEEGLKHKPDLVILVFCYGNDIRNNSRRLEELLWGPGIKSFGRPYAKVSDGDHKLEFVLPDQEKVRDYLSAKKPRSRRSNFLSHSLVLRQIYLLWNVLRGESEASKFDPNLHPGWPFLESYYLSKDKASLTLDDYTKLWNEAWMVTRRVIVAMKTLVQEHGAELMVVTVPPLQVDPEVRRRVEDLHPDVRLDIDKINRVLGDFCRREGIPFLDLLPSFSEAYKTDGVPLFHKFDLHWNAAGHEVAASEVARFLEKRGYRSGRNGLRQRIPRGSNWIRPLESIVATRQERSGLCRFAFREAAPHFWWDRHLACLFRRTRLMDN